MTELLRVVSANDLFKERFRESLGYALVAATFVHALVFALWPTMTIESFGDDPDAAPTLIDLLEPIPLPPPPDELPSPALPVPTDAVDATATIDPSTWDDVVLPPPPPPAMTAGRSIARNDFTPVTVNPSLANPEEYQRALQAAYPRTLRDARIGGTVSLQIFVNEDGRVANARIAEPSAYEAFDRAALGLVDQMRFNPALNREDRVAVWVNMPIVFSVR